ncbi:gas vesicle protein [Flavobacterium magnum]|uniref:Gas vesicle protein n=1 Tax=Flavobacterium magnum TaxID=2162713 RepID=A0A2S0RFJ6_9FLAO|nr:YtxH domain-containing protein [Flavobacterium magnum]AWA30436.1 gas vesicle protein [Flavobacterium magnum]
MSTGKVVLGALAGLAAGAVLGILFAPDKGSATRGKIAKKGKDSVDGLKQKYTDVIDQISSRFESVKDRASDFYEEGKEIASEARSSAASAANAVK